MKLEDFYATTVSFLSNSQVWIILNSCVWIMNYFYMSDCKFGIKWWQIFLSCPQLYWTQECLWKDSRNSENEADLQIQGQQILLPLLVPFLVSWFLQTTSTASDNPDKMFENKFSPKNSLTAEGSTLLLSSDRTRLTFQFLPLQADGWTEEGRKDRGQLWGACWRPSEEPPWAPGLEVFARYLPGWAWGWRTKTDRWSTVMEIAQLSWTWWVRKGRGLPAWLVRWWQHLLSHFHQLTDWFSLSF